MNELIRVSDMDEQALKAIMEQYDFTACTLRQFYHATIGVGQHISFPDYSPNIVPHRGLYIIAALLRILGQRDEDIISILGTAFRQQPKNIGMYAGTSMLLRRKSKQTSIEFSFGDKDEHRSLISYKICDVHHDGRVFLESHLSSGIGRGETICKPEDEIEYILRYVNK